MKKLHTSILFLFFFVNLSIAQNKLTVEKIMQDPKWMGTFPSNLNWDAQGQLIYFNYNKNQDPSDSLYKISLNQTSQITKVGLKEQLEIIPNNASDNISKTKKLFSKSDELFLYESALNKKKSLLLFGDRISNPRFLKDENRIAFESKNNLYVFDIPSGKIQKVTNIQIGVDPESKEKKASQKEEWLKEDNLRLLGVIKDREDKKAQTKAYREATEEKKPKPFFTGTKQISNLQLSPDEKFVTFSLITRSENKRTDVPDYTEVTGYTTNIAARTKVGDDPVKVELGIYNLTTDSVMMVSADNLPGIKDLPDYVKDYPEKKWEEKDRKIIPSSPVFSNDGKNAIINIRSFDNKDRWISLLDLSTGTLKTLDRQRDEAWVGGPGVGSSFGGGTLGWLSDNKHIYFQSEETGFSHLYLLDITSGTKKALTAGNYEVFNPFISKDGKSWYLTSSEVHPGERHFYKMPLMGGKMEKLTSMTGNNDVTLSPDEKQLAILFSSSNQPWELYLQANSSKAKAKQLTDGQSNAFKEYPWRESSLIHFDAADGAKVPARLYTPDASNNNGAAVIFVHGAGYLQNVHKWWSSYFREYMFHNLLTDLGYTVLDIDYRGSAGYGRDWRTAIYRHMGGKDLSDQVDGAKYLMAQHGVNPGSIGIYGGSYGGFITLMALFNASETFTSGGALRSVTDWAHYNHGYTSNILNEPFNDPIAYERSSPINFAEGLKGNLLIAHGMLDVNVHFQDVVRLAQRLIELEKDNWEMAVYPVEDHGFVEPSSWTDEYKRILKLFNETLLK
ncbi:prolyl oligopeptidase family serine peptidase [Rhodonellum sp.]|uniref:S9 family peptidase n=1 Tax=Rhodonellum sp. TaxID=2231180 RepID=UPI0027234BDC|nr:prolyl oligopeptidase family serine peptidase [Rhodonellum sp.]MDO9553902.1 prolyl oligopeptidase family serine peptidase [Rhodonellum sp.]